MSGYTPDDHDRAAEKMWRDIESLPDDPIGRARALAAFGRKMCQQVSDESMDEAYSACVEPELPLLILGPGGEYRREIHEEDIDGAPKL